MISVAFPLAMAMAEFPPLRGLLQRAMFFVSFLFVLREFALTRPFTAVEPR